MVVAEFSLSKFIVVINGVTFDEWDAAADSFSLTQVADSMSLVEAFGKHVFVDTGSRAHTCQIKLLQHGSNQKQMRKWKSEQDRDMSSVTLNMKAYDPINGDEIIATGGKIQTPSAMVRGNAHNPNTWMMVFPNVTIKESTNQ